MTTKLTPKMRSELMTELGRIGGRSKSAKKAASSKRNGALAANRAKAQTNPAQFAPNRDTLIVGIVE